MPKIKWWTNDKVHALAAAEAVQVAAVAKKFIKKKEQVKNG